MPAVGCAFWLRVITIALGAMLLMGDAVAQAPSASSDIVEKLKSRAPSGARTRGLRTAPAPDMSVVDRVMKRRTRGITVEERREIASVAESRPSIDMDIPFDFDSAAITPRAADALRNLGEALSHSDLMHDRFLLAGHTDGKGSAEYNLALSQKRAEAVKQYLIEKFLIGSDRLLAIGYGFENLKVPSNPLADANRRVQISNIGSSSTAAAPARAVSDVSGTGPRTRSAVRQQIDGALDEIATAPASPPSSKEEPAGTDVATMDVNVEVLPGTDVRIGDIISLRITSRIAGSLIVYEEDAAGNVTQIFPNSLSAGGRAGEARTTIAVSESITVPGPMDRFQLRVTPPAGESRIIAIVLPKSVKVDDVASPNAGMKPVADPGSVFQTLAKRTRGVRVEPSERAVGIRTYTISK
jgi:outer membrane protein OmpA-like peptidoglycan-associated protein